MTRIHYFSQMKNILLLLLWLFTSLAWAQGAKPYVLIISMDAFRWDYPEKYDLKNIKAFGQNGVRAESMEPSFPSKTFPNHYTIATGLYPDHHGIVMNSFYDPEMKMAYKVSDRVSVMNGDFYGGEPIWVTAEIQGLKSASFFWVGSEAPIQGLQPSYWKVYEHNLPYEQRIDTVMHWFNLPQAERPHLVMLYFDEPDGAGHNFGPDNPKTGVVLERMDSVFALLLYQLSTLPIADSLNIILLADHGMGPVSPERTILLDSILDSSWVVQAQGGNPVYNLEVKEGYLDSVLFVLNNTQHIKAWKRGEAPEHLHYRTNSRLLDITVAADSAWSIHWGRGVSYASGTHGYDPHNKDMHAIFMANGPVFQRGLQIPSFQNIEVYNIIAHILGLVPANNDGSIERIRPLFRK